ncbi:MAG: malonyl-CoA decarboxylase family protein [Desulfuromonadales bacterium]|nr:malonyl-CoA decarboxylase family protein [Desulfuromonadales bacterium]
MLVNNGTAERFQQRFTFRSIQEIARGWRGLTDIAQSAFSNRIDPQLPFEDEKKVVEQMGECVTSQGGDISAKARAASLATIYLDLNSEGRQKFLNLLAEHFDTNADDLQIAMQTLQTATDQQSRTGAELELRAALVPPRMQLLKTFNTLPDGFRFLINLRADLLPIRGNSAALHKLNIDLKQLLANLFDVNLLDLREITWDSSASLLEKLMAYEAVHEIASWSDMKQRLNTDRRCFAFFHNKVKDEPLTFVEVALVPAIPAGIQSLLDKNRQPLKAEEATTAIFYSISNAQKGLAGIKFGNFLIKQVVETLSKELKGLKVFATLSPVPGFRKWLDQAEAPILKPFFPPQLRDHLRELSGHDPVRQISTILDADWIASEELKQQLKTPLLSLCVHYLLTIKKRGKAHDPVAHFHLSNGSRLDRINWLGDLSANGLKQSAGLMVNYRYKLEHIDANHEAYIGDGEIVCGKEVRKIRKKFKG